MGSPDRLEIAFRAAADALIPRGSRVLVAVSGGSDSVSLLHLLARAAPRRDLTVSVAHLDHGLRRGSAADRRFVERLAGDLGLPCAGDRRDVAALSRRGESPEEAARRVRRAFLLEAARACGAERVVLGHTMDDQAETVLLRLARGAGPSAVAGMTAAGPGPFVRPLLGLRRDDLRAWLARHRFPFRDDPSNRSERFDRNRLRRRVVPVLRDAINPRAVEHVAAFAERIREDSTHLDALAARALARLREQAAHDRVTLDARRLAALPPALAKRVARSALGAAGADGRRVTARHVDAMLALARGPAGKFVELGGGLRAIRHDRRLSVGTRSALGRFW